ncbi:MAG: hypothetical protein KG029_05320 [Bacteroidetes bacterium]|nr:hypothetical protein [Bacteroidota bacterium]
MNVLFLGDSITEAFRPEAYFPGMNVVNHGISGLSSEELSQIIEPEWFSNEPDIVFLCIGTNDIARGFAAEKTNSFIKLLIAFIREYTKKGTAIYLISLFPTRNNPPRPNHLINRLNQILHETSLQWETSYLHLTPYFSDQNGELLADFTDDGLHLTHKAYEHWRDLLLPLIRDRS